MSPSRFAPSCTLIMLSPVTLPPGRLKPATRPSCTGSALVMKTIGIVVVALLAAGAARCRAERPSYDGHVTANTP